MQVGLTYDLRQDYLDLGFSEEETLEFDQLATIQALEETLRQLGFRTERIGNVWSLVQHLAAGRRWEMVFNIAEGLAGFGREAQVPALLEAYGIPYTFSDPLTLSLALHKGLAKRVVRDAGLPTPDFFLLESPAQAAKVALQPPLFAKPVAEGTGKGVSPLSKIDDLALLEPVCAEMIDRFQQPVLVESFLPGREFTAGIVGTGRRAEVIGVMEVILKPEAEAEVYSAENKEHWEERVIYQLVDDQEARRAGEVALAAYRALGCRDAGRVDLRSDHNNEPSFMEVNPLAGIHPSHSDLPILAGLAGVSYLELIGRIMDSALERSEVRPLPALARTGADHRPLTRLRPVRSAVQGGWR